ncbi:MAG: polysaccharide pyruvyl transferase CsaB [cyanobacterium endosymbiont of Rhopalodia musculus]|uniref:polysaccharide pyruvyl transferase CsaB n=1 Tax=cyanobacterium endosymbiont of Epithemia clementina EcSB TaxID=3034674 RepID=UPI00247FF828|nr:polysaccharide pyruvyl transferase CsaB [cyanobacterium endosymbiont of Epithemia clementina EcSB]WGT67294.1 polysaccharide pyruvyl transferase CsaB [cyanobacterium endosymbiont of Epithemia clementina EcSB]
MKKAVICGYYGQGNGGDEALLVSLLQMLPSQIQPIVLSANPRQTHKRYGVKSCSNRSAFAILKVLKTSDLFIWGGGSLMQDVTSWTSPIYYAVLMALAQQKGLKTIAWAQGIGPLRRPFTRWLTHQVLLGCTAVSVRDGASAKLVSQWHINPLIAPDPVWALKGKSIPGLVDIPAPRVAVNLRKHPQLTPQRLKILTKALINFQKATNVCLLLVPFQASQDLSIAHSLASQLPGSYQIIYLEDPRELKGLFREVEMTIGMRLHSLIMAVAEESRCFALSYDPKVSRLMEEIDLPGWKLTELPDDPSIISSVWLECYANGKTLNRNHLQSLVDRALIHQEIFKLVCDL